METIMDLTAAIAKQVATLPAFASHAMGGGTSERTDAGAAAELDDATVVNVEGTAPGPKPVLQMTSVPLTIDPARYVNPLTNSNPRGTLTSLFALRALVDPVPDFTRFYNNSGKSTETAWKMLVKGAKVSDPYSFAGMAVSEAQKKYAQISYPNLDGTIGQWRPVYATPEDWYDFSIPDRFQPFEIDLTDPDSPQSAFTTLGDTSFASLKWTIGGGAGGAGATSVAVDPNTKLHWLRTNALLVMLSRPWLDLSLCSVNGFSLGGQRRGLFSSGRLDTNTGFMPLLPSGFLLGTDTQIKADWASQDVKIIATAQNNAARVALGHFALSSGPARPSPPGGAAPAQPNYEATFDGKVVSSSAVQLIAWVSTLVPLCPQLDG
jgi:hypothetical protein